MHDRNPYCPPANAAHEEENLPRTAEPEALVLSTPFSVLVISTIFAVLIAGVAVMGLVHLIASESHWSMYSLVALFMFCSYLFMTSYFTRLTIDSRGVRMQGFRRCNCGWGDIESWYRDETTGAVCFVKADGKTIMVSSFAVTNRVRNDMVERAFQAFMGGASMGHCLNDSGEQDAVTGEKAAE